MAGVSPITVSRALSNPGRVSASTREKVLAAVAATGYAVNPLASGLKSGRSLLIVACAADFGAPEIARRLANLSMLVEQTSYHLVVTSPPTDPQARAIRLNALRSLRPAALVWLDNSAEPAFEQIGTPTLRADPPDTLPARLFEALARPKPD